MYKSPSCSGKGVAAMDAKEFGDHVTADHVVLYRDNERVIEESRLALVMKDVATTCSCGRQIGSLLQASRASARVPRKDRTLRV